MNKQLEKQAFADEFSGLNNRRGMLIKFEEIDLKSQQTHKTLPFIIADLDGFKLFNDTMGHIAGDQFYAEFGALLCKILDLNQINGRGVVRNLRFIC